MPTPHTRPDRAAQAEQWAVDVAAAHGARSALGAGLPSQGGAWHSLPPALLTWGPTGRLVARYPITYRRHGGPLVGGVLVPSGMMVTVDWQAVTRRSGKEVMVDSGAITLSATGTGPWPAVDPSHRPASADLAPRSPRLLRLQLDRLVTAGDAATAAAMAAARAPTRRWLASTERGRVLVGLVGAGAAEEMLVADAWRLIGVLAGMGRKPACCLWATLLAGPRARTALRAIADFSGLSESQYLLAAWALATGRYADPIAALVVAARAERQWSRVDPRTGRYRIGDATLARDIAGAVGVVGAGGWPSDITMLVAA